MLYEIELQRLVRQVLDNWLLPPLHQLVLNYSGCEFEGNVFSSQCIEGEVLGGMFCTQSGKLVVTTTRRVEGEYPDENVTWIICPSGSPSPSPTPTLSPIKQFGWDFTERFNMKETNKDEEIVQDSLGRTIQFYIDKTEGILEADCLMCLTKAKVLENCWANHQKYSEREKVREFDTGVSLNIEQVSNCFHVIWPVRTCGHDNEHMKLAFRRSRCEYPTVYQHHADQRIIEQSHLFIKKNEICALQEGFHCRKLDWTSMQAGGYAASKDGLILGAMVSHTKRIKPIRSRNRIVCKKYFPCTVLWWKRESINTSFVQQGPIPLESFVENLDEISNYQCLLEFTSSKSYLVIALSTSNKQQVKSPASTRIQLLIFDLKTLEIVLRQHLTFSKRYPKIVMSLGKCEGHQIQVLLGYLVSPLSTSQEKRKLCTGETKKLILINLGLRIHS